LNGNDINAPDGVASSSNPYSLGILIEWKRFVYLFARHKKTSLLARDIN